MKYADYGFSCSNKCQSHVDVFGATVYEKFSTEISFSLSSVFRLLFYDLTKYKMQSFFIGILRS